MMEHHAEHSRARRRRLQPLPSLLLTALAAAAPLTVVYTLSPVYHIAPTLAFNLAEVALLFAVARLLSLGNIQRFELGDHIFALYLAWCAAVVLWHWAADPELVDIIGRSVTNFTRAVLTLQIFWYLIGRLIAARRPPPSWVVWSLFVLMMAAVVVQINPETLSIDFESIDNEELNYLAIADPFALWALLLLAYTARRRWLFILLFCSSAAALFAIGSRGSLYAFLASGALFAIVVAPRLSFAVAAAAVAGVIMIVGPEISDTADLGRMFAIASIATDPSYIQREEQRAVAFDQIAAHPLTGDYGGTIRVFGNLGAYTHDITSYWQHFGFVPFVLVIALVCLACLAFVQSAGRIRSNDYSGIFDTFLVLYFPFVIIQIALARSYDWPFIWMLLGFAVSNQARSIEETASRPGSKRSAIGRCGTPDKNPRNAAPI